MNIIKTKSFELSVLTRGDENSKRLAILIPGKLDTKDYINSVSHAEYLANCGFFALAFDPPGTWESSGNIELVTTTNYIKAINELIEYFGNKPTILLGHSRGGAAAMLASSNSTVNGVVTVMANYGTPTAPEEQSVQQGFQVSYRDLPPGDSKTVEQKEFKLPINYWEDGKKYNPLEVLKECTKPKLLIYGTRDEFCSPNEAKRAYESLPDPKIILEMDSAHDYRYYSEAIKEVNEAIGQFIKQFNL